MPVSSVSLAKISVVESIFCLRACMKFFPHFLHFWSDSQKQSVQEMHRKIVCLENRHNENLCTEMKFLRRIMGKTRRDKWRNNRIRETLDQEPVLNYVERRSIQWYGHVVRMQDYRKPKQAMEARRREEEVEEDQGGLGRTV